MAQAEPLRHEQKYYISQGDAYYLSTVLKHCMDLDSFHPNGTYAIRSLYFDDCFNSAMVDKLDGVMARHKYRIRIYNYSDETIRLERKSKKGDYISKVSCGISRDLAEQIIAGDPYGLERLSHPLLQDVYRMMTTRMLRPAVIVDYVRQAFIHPCEETRVTFDSQLRTGYLSSDMFNPELPTFPCLNEEQVILEVKYNRRFPEYLVPILSTIPTKRSAISKYTFCRRYEFNL